MYGRSVVEVSVLLSFLIDSYFSVEVLIFFCFSRVVLDSNVPLWLLMKVTKRSQP